MKNNIRRTLGLVLAVCILLSMMLTGCSNASSGTTTDPTQTTDTPNSSNTSSTEPADADAVGSNDDRAHVTISVLQYGMAGMVEDLSGDRIKAEIEKLVNVDLDYQTDANEVYDQNLELNLMSDTAQDLFHNWGELDKTSKWISDGVLFNIGEFVAANPERYPILNKMFQSPEWKMFNEYYSGDGDSTYAIYALAFNKAWNSGIIYNTDIMNEAGFSESPKTVDEFIEYCKNANALGYTPYFPRNNKLSNASIIDQTFAAPYGTTILAQSGASTNGMWQAADGTWECMTVSDESRAVIEMLHQMFVDGAFPSTLGVEDDWGPMLDGFINNTVGAINYFIDDPAMFNWALNTQYRKGNADATVEDLTIGNILQGPAGYAKKWGTSYSMAENWMIPASCEHPDRVLDLIEFLASDEGQNLVHKGIEGVHYVDDENGRPVFNKDEWLVETSLYGQGDGRCVYSYFCYLFSGMNQQLALETTDNWYEASANGDSYTIEVYADNEAYTFAAPIMEELTELAFEELPVYYTIISFSDDQLTMRAKLNEVWLQYVPSFITGAKDIDAEWEDYIAAYKAAGSDEITQALNDAVSVAEANYTKYTK